MVLIATVLDAEGKIARKVAVAETDGKCWDGDWDSASGKKAEEDARKHETWNQSTAWPLTLLEDEEVLGEWLRRGMGVHVDATGMLRLHVADECVLRGRNYKISDRDAQRDESGRIVGGTLSRAGARQVVVQMPEAHVSAGLLLYRKTWPVVQDAWLGAAFLDVDRLCASLVESHPGCAVRVEELVGPRVRVWPSRDAAAAASRKSAAAAAAAASQERREQEQRYFLRVLARARRETGDSPAAAAAPDEAGPPAPSAPSVAKRWDA